MIVFNINSHHYRISVQFAAQNESLPTIQLAKQGWIQGKLLKTVGNLNNEPKTIYSYRNIPYADHEQFRRFQVILEMEEISSIAKMNSLMLNFSNQFRIQGSLVPRMTLMMPGQQDHYVLREGWMSNRLPPWSPFPYKIQLLQ